MKIKIFARDLEFEAELEKNATAKAIYHSLPVDGSVNRWGDEIFFVVPVKIDYESDATELVEEGDIAYWPEGSSFCIFFGKTPNSTDHDILAASKVNIFGKISGSYKELHKIKNGDLIIVEQA